MLQQDCSRRFIFEDLGVRGHWVRLTDSWQTAKKLQHSHPLAKLQLGQALSAVVLLASTIKFKGSLILQTHGAEPLKTLVAQVTHDRKIRGLVRCQPDLPDLSDDKLYGDGQLVLTINPEQGSAYQGIVPLQGQNLAGALETYFAQSEQLSTRLWLAADETSAVGLMLQQMPSISDWQDWERLEILANTLTKAELLGLDCEDLLYRLFNEENVRVFEPEPVRFECSCSPGKIENTLRLLGRDELESILAERGEIEVNCEFCNKHYRFDKVDIESVLLGQNQPQANSQVRH